MPLCSAWNRDNAQEVLAVVIIARLLITVVSQPKSQIPHTLRLLSYSSAWCVPPAPWPGRFPFINLPSSISLSPCYLPCRRPSSLGKAEQCSASSALTHRTSLQRRHSFAAWSIPSSSPWEGSPAPDGSWMSCRFLCLSLKEAEGTIGLIVRGVFMSLFLLATNFSCFLFPQSKFSLVRHARDLAKAVLGAGSWVRGREGPIWNVLTNCKLLPYFMWKLK